VILVLSDKLTVADFKSAPVYLNLTLSLKRRIKFVVSRFIEQNANELGNYIFSKVKK
jgi:hypothetical protein